MFNKKFVITFFSLVSLIATFVMISPKTALAAEKNDLSSAMNRSQIPINRPLSMSGMDENGVRRGFVNVGPFANWDYAYLRLNNNSNRFIFERGSSNTRFRIRVQSPNWRNFDYFNISNRGYVYLDRRENAREFTVQAQDNGGFKIFTANNGQEVGIFRWAGSYYLTIGSRTIPMNWLIF